MLGGVVLALFHVIIVVVVVVVVVVILFCVLWFLILQYEFLTNYTTYWVVVFFYI